MLVTIIAEYIFIFEYLLCYEGLTILLVIDAIDMLVVTTNDIYVLM